MPLLALPGVVVTTTLPLAAPVGTTATMLVSDQLEMEAVWPAKVTVPAVLPKVVPEMVIWAAAGALDGSRLLMTGRTTKNVPLLVSPPAAVTITLPEVAPAGTVTVIWLALQLLMFVAGVPLNVTAPPWDGPKFDPLMLMVAPTPPESGPRLVMLGAPPTVNRTPPLCTPPAAVTTTLPVVAPAGTVAVMLLLLQELILAVTPLHATLPLP